MRFGAIASTAHDHHQLADAATSKAAVSCVTGCTIIARAS